MPFIFEKIQICNPPIRAKISENIENLDSMVIKSKNYSVVKIKFSNDQKKMYSLTKNGEVYQWVCQNQELDDKKCSNCNNNFTIFDKKQCGYCSAWLCHSCWIKKEVFNLLNI